MTLLNVLDGLIARLARRPWQVDDLDSGVHIWPVRDAVDHDLAGIECLCGPTVNWVDPDTGETWPNGPLVTHHSLDGREAHE